MGRIIVNLGTHLVIQKQENSDYKCAPATILSSDSHSAFHNE